jgi:hypothetical protein
MSPFTVDTVKTLLLILVWIAVFYFWDFPFYPLINIALKSVLIVASYVYVVYTLKFSEDISGILDGFLKK